MEISGVYKITNTVTGDFYIGSSKDVKRRWKEHKKPSTLKKCPNNPMCLEFQKYGTDKFSFEILEEVKPESLKEAEQQFIKTLKPTYNSNNANGLDVSRYKEYQIEYYQQNRKKQKEYQKEYYNQTCYYNSETLTLNALSLRFRKAGIENPTKEAKKYLIKKEPKTPIEFYDVYP